MSGGIGRSASIRDEIVERRRRRILKEGHTLGHNVPEVRQLPVVPFGRDPFVICEVKRRSPSRGDIAAELDPVRQAEAYSRSGVRSVSVLTEEDYFSGSLADLIAIKNEHRELSVLRKDFLLDREDIEISYRAGADAVLLIASLFTAEEFATLFEQVTALGMAALVEVHDTKDVATVRSVKPPLVGINSRDLRTFRVDRLRPLSVAGEIDWPADVVFESGIWCEEDVVFARSNGFAGVLVGESVTRQPALIPELLRGMDSATGDGRFWSTLAPRSSKKQPLVKICGICREEDGRLATELGADMLGFIFAESPRKTTPAIVRSLSDLDVLKVAVVVTDSGELPAEVGALLDGGFLDAVQYHGDESPSDCFVQRRPYYKALQIRDEASLDGIEKYRSPRTLVDAFSDDARGGTGKRLAMDLVDAIRSRTPLWLAGGLSPSNVRETILRAEPELVDVSSGVEAQKGRKDHTKLRRFFQEIQYADPR